MLHRYAHILASLLSGALLLFGGLPALPMTARESVAEPAAPLFQASNAPGAVQIEAGSFRTCVINQAGQLYCWGANTYGSSEVPADLAPVTQVSAGESHTCAVTTAGVLRCWGNNANGQVTVPPNLGPVTQVSAGALHTCAVTAAGLVRCWGSNDLGQATIPADLGLVTQVSGRSNHTCAVTAAGLVRCWGRNDYGQATVPPDLGVASQVSASGFHTCALMTDGSLRCWGRNQNEQATVPPGLAPVIHVSTGEYHTCALTPGGSLHCWGRNEYGQTTIPPDLGSVTQVSVGGWHTCALTAGGVIRCWGRNEQGQTPAPTDLGSVRQVSAGSEYTCALTAAGMVYCWGGNEQGQATVPPDLGSVTQISTSLANIFGHTCALTDAGTVRCWGYNQYGQTTVPPDLGPVSQISIRGNHTCALTDAEVVRCWGRNEQGQTTVPLDLGPVTQVSAGSGYTCAVTAGGTLRCWGYNNYGQATVPPDLGPVTQVSAGSGYTCALTTGGAVRCWGYNAYGQTTVPWNLGAITQVTTGEFHTCVLTVAGAVRCWGLNEAGEMTVPPDLGSVIQVNVGWQHTCVVTVAGAVRCWGYNQHGQAIVPRNPLTIQVATVRGQVSDGTGKGLAGVTLTAWDRSTITDATGSYTLTGVALGNRTLTPSLAGYHFDPPIRTIVVNANLGDQNFSATAIPTVTPTATATATATPTATAIPTVTPTATATATPVPNQPNWLVMLYLAGDDLEPDRAGTVGLSEALAALVQRLQRMPHNPALRLVILYDGSNQGDSKLYLREPNGLRDVTEAALRSGQWIGGMPGSPGAREFDTGSTVTLRNFVSWATATYPGPQHRFLSLVDHGGGWAPDLDQPGQPRGQPSVQAGGWRGMSLDLTSGGSSLATRETREALSDLDLDVLFFDACLMAMIESAYEVRDVADYLIAGQNLLFARLPYELYLADLTNSTTPFTLTERIVQRYNPGPSAPYTLSALDLRRLRANVPNNLALEVNRLAERLLVALPDPAPSDHVLVQALTQAYTATQKFDYDSSGLIDEREGYVDLVGFARALSANPSLPADVRSAANAVVSAAVGPNAPVVIARATRSGSFQNQAINLDGANGISIFLPLGERDYRPTRYDPTRPDLAYPERQLTYYVECEQLAFSCDVPRWGALLERLEPTVPIIRTGPDGLAADDTPASLTSSFTVDTRPFNAPFPLAAPEQVYLPLVRR